MRLRSMAAGTWWRDRGAAGPPGPWLRLGAVDDRRRRQDAQRARLQSEEAARGALEAARAAPDHRSCTSSRSTCSACWRARRRTTSQAGRLLNQRETDSARPSGAMRRTPQRRPPRLSSWPRGPGTRLDSRRDGDLPPIGPVCASDLDRRRGAQVVSEGGRPGPMDECDLRAVRRPGHRSGVAEDALRRSIDRDEICIDRGCFPGASVARLDRQARTVRRPVDAFGSHDEFILGLAWSRCLRALPAVRRPRCAGSSPTHRAATAPRVP